MTFWLVLPVIVALWAVARERARCKRVQVALRKACRLARIARAWDPGPRNTEFYQDIADCEKFAGKDEREGQKTTRSEGVLSNHVQSAHESRRGHNHMAEGE